jgi:hypothetical protein
MAETVNVRSIAALQHFRTEFCNFAEDARNALNSVEMEVRRTRDWLRQQDVHWKAQVKKCNERVNQARSDLHRKRVSQSGSDVVTDSDQKEALRAAQRHLREAEEKVLIIRKWIPILDKAIEEYHGLSQPLGDRLQGDVAHALSLLDRFVDTLHAYVALAPPPTARAAMAGTESAVPTAPAAARGSASRGGSEEAPAAQETPADGESQAVETNVAAAENGAEAGDMLHPEAVPSESR